ncbi:MAG: asparagine synthase (glutamine-hydrolyzing), partial [Candidatus Eisenbacteria bacterium]|nr:asparagine synthase (glutamine-hydrolyzing) [Candidatus Eisenbacteria bacterium]
MCGIAGIVNFRGDAPPETASLRRMAGALRHRGPDAFGVYRDKIAGLAHARLSIIDLVTGQQPLCNENEKLWITFNGEIYNYVELRRQLVDLGHSFRTQSDTEVIVHAYEEWGHEAFARFNGQFAFALWNSESKKLILARDPHGIRPLYICRHKSSLFFASEVKAIFAAEPSIPRAFDPEGLEETFTFWSIVPPQSIFRGIEELPPGCIQTYTAEGMAEKRFYEPHYPHDGAHSFQGSIDEATEAVREVLEEAVRLRILRSDVPVGCYLSGGLDSSLVAALGLGVKGDKFCTYSLRFEDAEFDETDYQRIMADRLGSEHHEVMVSRRDIAEAFPLVVLHTERPILRTAPTPLFLLSKLVHDSNIKVVLTGEGADEMFAGYDLFREAKVRRFWARQPESEWRPRLLERLYPYLARSPVTTRNLATAFFGRDLAHWREPGFSHGPRWQTTAALKRLLSPEIRTAVAGRDVATELLASFPAAFHKWSFLAQDQYLECRTLLSGYLLSSQ